MARLVIYSSGAVNQTVELTGRNVRIGRAKENDVVLADPTQVVSRFHAELRYEDGHYILLDLNSANGTWVWDHRIQRVVLSSGTVVEIGSYRVALETDTEATTAPPVASVPPAVLDAPVVVPPPIVSAPPAAPARATPPARAGVPEDSLTTTPRVVIQPSAEAETTGADGGARPARTVWQSKRLMVAGVVLVGFALIAVGMAVGGRFSRREQTDEDSRPGQAPAAAARAELPTVSGPPAEPPVVLAATSAEKQEVAAPAVSAPRAAAKVPRPAPLPAPTPAAEARLDAVRVVPGLARRAGESQAEYTARADRVQALYGDARTALQAKDFASAVRLFERLETEQPGVLDVPAKLAESRGGLRASRRAAVEAAMAGGAAAERRGDFVEAQREYERAFEADPASGADEALGRVRARMKALGDDAFKRARTFDAFGRTEDAIAQYERAVQLLSSDDPNRKSAKQRLDVLRAGIIK
jgi:pSer/pThr/pTyr-binding forkhead associated (FHA) protein